MYNPLHALFAHNSHTAETAVAEAPDESETPAPVILTSVGEYRRQHPERPARESHTSTGR